MQLKYRDGGDWLPIIESGFNASGSWYRIGDMQVCTGTFEVSEAGWLAASGGFVRPFDNIVFPQSFSEVPAVTMAAHDRNSYHRGAFVAQYWMDSERITSGQLRAEGTATQSATYPVVVTYTAIGKGVM